MNIEEEVDRLYQLPPTEFTAARNALVRRVKAPAERARLHALQKPTTPAWAVNQLYWRKRRVFARLMEAAARLRAEHGRQLSGKTADIEAAERAHHDALKAASDEIRELLRSAGETDTPALMHAIADTLRALPGRDDHGRLTRPLKPLGFEALAGLVPRGGATIARLADTRPALTPPPAAPARGGEDRSGARDAAARKRAAQAARAKDIAAAERALRQAQAAERTARGDHARAEMQLARVQRERKNLQDEIDALTTRRDQLAVELDQRRRDAEKATAERERLETRLKELRRPG